VSAAAAGWFSVRLASCSRHDMLFWIHSNSWRFNTLSFRYFLIIPHILLLFCFLVSPHHPRTYSIIYRDLKPDNIGFDVRDDVKIFDFGLAAEMHPSLRVNGTNTYRLTAESGSPRYMAPEVALGQPYNHLVDV
jgi:serine/threonine protein kinase